ncbi:MAG TPA: hypothetical protein ENK31_06325 [Nannocystis exedens]|nr:hypothetical protein [Nannocystis exedens]
MSSPSFSFSFSICLTAVALSLGACPQSEGMGETSTSSASESESNTSGETTSSTTGDTSSSDPTTGETTMVGPRCGDGFLNEGEICDDGNISNADGCLADCTPATCGDGFLWIGSEECDEGDDNDAKDPMHCRLTCMNPVCGDGALYATSFAGAITLGTKSESENPTLNTTSPRSVAIDGAGNIYTVFTSNGVDLGRAIVERYTAEGLFESSFAAVSSSTKIVFPSLGVSAEGTLIVAWQQLIADNQFDVLYGHFTGEGSVLDGPISASANASNNHRNPVVAVNSSGAAVIAFRSQMDMGELHEIRARIVPTAGTPPAPFVVSTFAGTSAPSVAIRNDDSFVIAYSTKSTPGKIYVHDYSSKGEQRLAIEAVPGLQGYADDNFPWVGTAALDNGDFALSAANPAGQAAVKRYNSDGDLIDDVVASSMGYAWIPQIDLDSDRHGNLVALWAGCGLQGEEDIACQNLTRLHLQQIYADGTLFEDTILVDPLDNWQRRGIGVAVGTSGDIAVVGQNVDAPFLKIAKVACP